MKPNNFPLRPKLDGSEELYTQTAGLSQKFTLETAKAFITKPIDIIYSELYNKVINQELVTGSWYRLTDYKNVNFLNGWEIANNNPTPSDPNFNPQEIFTGEAEVLLLQATSSSEISPIAYSENFPQDIITYQVYTNKLGVDIGGISNGSNLPDSSIVSGFDLQWDGANVYFNMPTGYPALYGHYFYLYCEFDGGSYYQDGLYEPLNPDGICQYPFTKTMSKIRLENNGTKVILLDLTKNDYLNYDADTLYVEHIYALGDAYGWITRRIDTQSKIDVPFDFRSKTYRRFEVDLSLVNASLGTGYYGQGDNYLGQGTTGNYKDLLSIDWKGYEIYNLEIGGQGGADMSWYNGLCDNIVFLGRSTNSKIGTYSHDNTIAGNFNNNTIGNYFNYNTVGKGFNSNTIGSKFYSNTIGSNFYSNTIGTDFNNNTIGNSFSNNAIGNSFRNNTIGNGSYNNTIGIFFQNNTIGSGFELNNIGNEFIFNTIGDNFQLNDIKNQFSSNTIDFSFQRNIIGNIFINNNIGHSFQFNNITHFFQYNTTNFAFQANIINNIFQNNNIGFAFFNNQINYAIVSCIMLNNFKDNIINRSLQVIDFSLATHVYGSYKCEIFTRSDGSSQLSYIDATNTIQYTAINA